MEFLLNHTNSFIFGLGAFLVFCMIVGRFGIRPVLKALDQRDATIAKALADAEATSKKAIATQVELNQRLAKVEAESATLLSEARREAGEVRAKIIADGEKTLDDLRERSLREIEQAKRQALVELRAEIAQVAIIVAEKLIHERIDANNSHLRMVDDTVSSIADANVAAGTASWTRPTQKPGIN
jgi:F-type H+-transporting ATPase subunit b